MTKLALHSVWLLSICLLTPSHSVAQEPEAKPGALAGPAVPRMPIYVWPIQRACAQDREATASVVRSLVGDARLAVQALAPAATLPSCSGVACAELLAAEGCERRTGVLVGGELEEDICDPTDGRYSGCHGQLVSRLRVFRVDVADGQAVRADYLYAVCEDGRCGAEARTPTDMAAALIAQLIDSPPGAPSLATPRSYPGSDALCHASSAVATQGMPEAPMAQAVPSTPPASPAGAASVARAVAFAYYTKFHHLADRGTTGGAPSYPTREAAEADALRRAQHFGDGGAWPTGGVFIAKTVNTKYSLLPGEDLVGNAQRINKLQSYLTSIPNDSAFVDMGRMKAEQRLLIVLVFNAETGALDPYVLEVNKPLRPVPSPPECGPGGGDRAVCVQAATAAALALVSPVEKKARPEPAPVMPAAPTGTVAAARALPLACLPFRTYRCPARSAAFAVASSPVPASTPPTTAPPQQTRLLRRYVDGALYGATGLSLLTAVALTIADSSGGAVTLTNSAGDTALVNGVLRPAQWTAWGLGLVFAVPTVISILDRFPSKAAVTEVPYTGAASSTPLCPIGVLP